MAKVLEKVSPEKIFDLGINAEKVRIGPDYVSFSSGLNNCMVRLEEAAKALGQYTVTGIAGALGQLRSAKSRNNYYKKLGVEND